MLTIVDFVVLQQQMRRPVHFAFVFRHLCPKVEASCRTAQRASIYKVVVILRYKLIVALCRQFE